MTQRKSAQAVRESFLPIVAQLMADVAAGRKVVVPCSNQTSDKAVRFLLNLLETSTDATADSEAIRATLQSALKVDSLPGVIVVTGGVHHLKDCFAIVTGNARVEMVGTGVLLAFGNAVVFARDRVSVHATGHAQVNLYDYVLASVDGHVQVNSYQFVTGNASGNVTGRARGKSRWTVSGDAFFDTYDNAVADAEGNAQLRSYGRSRVRSHGGNVVAQLFEGANGWFGDGSRVELNDYCIAYAHPGAQTTRKSGSSRVMPLHAGEEASWSTV
ncbi:MAG: hypothetical protein AB7W16_08235 [Candidatus Obscuribacterales bacterium]